MKIEVQKSFEKDIAKLKDKTAATAVLKLIDELENCESLSEILHLKKMTGKGNYYRIRIGDYRLGLKLSEQTLILLRFMSRKDIYKYFP
jgi:mRNA interferase RelE/StbE